MKNANEENYYTKFDNFRITQDRVFYNLIENVKRFYKEKSKIQIKQMSFQYVFILA